MAEKTVQEKAGARFGAGTVTMLDRLMSELAGPNRRIRQDASHMLAEMARDHQDQFEGKLDAVVPALADALFRPEAQTRWESLDALYELAAAHPDVVVQAYDGAEASLFDETSSRVRIASFRLLARLGSKSAELSDKVWPLLDEAIQCFHGDPGYRDMLASMLEFVQGEASAESKAALVDRISFDAENGRGYVKVQSAEIVKAAEGK